MADEKRYTSNWIAVPSSSARREGGDLSDSVLTKGTFGGHDIL